MIALDTNILVRYIARDDEAGYQRAARFLAGLTEESPGFITQVVMAEFYWVISRSYRFDRQTCLKVVRGLIETPTLEFDDGEGVIRALMRAEASGADFADALTQSAVELFGVDEVVTFDRAAADRLGWRLLAD